MKNDNNIMHNYRFLENNFKNLIKEESEYSNEWFRFFSTMDSSKEFDFSKQSQFQSNEYLIENSIKKFFRKYSYLFADLNPLLSFDSDLISQKFKDFIRNNNISEDKFENITKLMTESYLGKISAEFEHIIDDEKYGWLTSNFENLNKNISDIEKKDILFSLMEVELFEKFIHSKFQGSKRFSIEGADSSLIFFHEFNQESSRLGCTNVVLGMAHRGRLNFLTKLCGENYSSILGQFAGKNYIDEDIGNSGDVKYHLGSSRSCAFSHGGMIDILLMVNPSHLEAVNGVVLGRTKAIQDESKDSPSLSKKKIIPFLIHGDASFVGQGVVYECLAMNGVEGYDVGGCIHLIIDNQVGFTANASETRPSKYSSDVAKTLNAPIFHLNGDDPELALILARICARFRFEYNGDIVINLVCYRRFGHNEGDDPSFTQPKMYQNINVKKTVYELYKEKLLSLNIINKTDIENKENEFNTFLSKELDEFKSKKFEDVAHKNWVDHKIIFSDKDSMISKKTSITKDFINDKVLNILYEARNYKNINEKLKRLILESRISMLEKSLQANNEKIIDWGLAEMLAFCSILNDGKNIRISGEDCVRGTFAHRHSAFIDSQTEEKFFYYKGLASNNSRFDVYNSILSEYGVLGFEFGYSSLNPNNLVIWEAQFGDFANGAQIIIDQYIAASEQKWLMNNNLVLMLPHGYEGQGPEHSSARIERFLQLAAQFNMRIVQPTTPSNLFHILRSQVDNENVKKPLIIFTPKSLLRHKFVKSSLNEITNSSFEEIIFDDEILKNPHNIKKIIICSGKIYYDLYEKIIDRNDILLIRIEILYPFPIEKICSVLKKFNLDEINLIYAQDEPKNMGLYNFFIQNLGEFFSENKDEILAKNFNVFKDIQYIGRKSSASTANGSQYIHQKEQKEIIDECLR